MSQYTGSRPTTTSSSVSHITTQPTPYGSRAAPSQGLPQPAEQAKAQAQAQPEVIYIIDTSSDPLARGGVIYTGPKGLYDQRVKVKDPRYVGEFDYSPERTTDVSYLFKGPSGAKFPTSSKKWAGGIGWCINEAKSLNPPLQDPQQSSKQ